MPEIPTQRGQLWRLEHAAASKAVMG